MNTVYRQPGVVLPDRDNVIHFSEQARLAGIRAKKLARSARTWAYIAVGVNVVNLIYQVTYLAVKYNWFG